VLGDLAGLAGQAERGVGQPVLARVLGGLTRKTLILRELDGESVSDGAAECGP